MGDIFWIIGVIFLTLAILLFSTMTILRMLSREKGKRVQDRGKGDENELMKPKDPEMEVTD